MKTKKIGIIAEDKSDVKTIKILIQRISNKSFNSSNFTGGGCGKLMRKCRDWADLLYDQECNILLVIHDADKNSPKAIYDKLNEKLHSCSFRKKYICIPVEEIEAWLLSDPKALKKIFHLSKIPKIKSEPERINSPKETLGKVIRQASKNSAMYIHTVHNDKLASEISIEDVKSKCPSFNKFLEFISINL